MDEKKLAPEFQTDDCISTLIFLKILRGYIPPHPILGKGYGCCR